MGDVSLVHFRLSAVWSEKLGHFWCWDDKETSTNMKQNCVCLIKILLFSHIITITSAQKWSWRSRQLMITTSETFQQRSFALVPCVKPFYYQQFPKSLNIRIKNWILHITLHRMATTAAIDSDTHGRLMEMQMTWKFSSQHMTFTHIPQQIAFYYVTNYEWQSKCKSRDYTNLQNHLENHMFEMQSTLVQIIGFRFMNNYCILCRLALTMPFPIEVKGDWTTESSLTIILLIPLSLFH